VLRRPGQRRCGSRRAAATQRPEGQPPPASRAREQETVSLLVATLATTQGPVLICWEHDHIPTMTSTTSAPAARHTWPDNGFVMVLVSLKAPTRKGTPSYPLDQVPELPLSGDNHTPIS